MTLTADSILNVNFIQNNQQFHPVQRAKKRVNSFALTYYNKDTSQMLHGTSTCNKVLNKLVWSLHYKTFNRCKNE